jgi:hypothetical protein
MPWPPSELVRSAPQPDLPFVPPLWRRLDRRALGDVAHIAMMVTGWLAGNVLALLGSVVATFIVIAHGDFTVFMSHVDNLAARYVAADGARRMAFEHQVLAVLGVCGAGLLIIRLPRFVMRLRLELSQDGSDATDRA